MWTGEDRWGQEARGAWRWGQSTSGMPRADRHHDSCPVKTLSALKGYVFLKENLLYKYNGLKLFQSGLAPFRTKSNL